MTKRWGILQGDCIARLKQLPDNSIDAVVTDPPYELGFMGKKWDSSGIAYSIELWAEVLRVLKPGAHLLAFGGTRTYHRMACAIEDAGFEIRDSLHWMYGTGFPKSLDVGKAIEAGGGPESIRRLSMGDNYQPSGRGRVNYDHGGGSKMNGVPGEVDLSPEAAAWKGWGTALKPGHEPIVMARKPLDGTVAANVQEWGTGAINVDTCRIGSSGGTHKMLFEKGAPGVALVGSADGAFNGPRGELVDGLGRWPANVILDEDAAAELDAQSGTLKSGGTPPRRKGMGFHGGAFGQEETDGVGSSSGGASRFFYIAKATKREREAGCETLPLRSAGEATDREDGSDGLKSPRAGAGRTSGARNFHPTVKPVQLMRYLVRLVTPPGGVVLDPFTGSGTTGMATVAEGFRFIGFEREPEYVQIASSRIAAYEKVSIDD